MTTLQMNETRWSIARNLASTLMNKMTDVAEFDKVTAFMRQYHKADDALDKFNTLLQQLAYSSDAPTQSGKTREYYKIIQDCCQKHLEGINDPNELLLILGWCRRLIRYYKVEPKRADEEQLPQQQKQTQKQPKMQLSFLKKETEKLKIKVGDKVNATILKKDQFKVTVQLDTDNKEKLTFERPYYPGKIGATVKLKVNEVNEDAHITKVIP